MESGRVRVAWGRAARVAVAAAMVAIVGSACRIEKRPPVRVLSPADSARSVDSTAVVAMIDAYYEDLSARDWDAFASHFWAGADITTVFSPPSDSVSRVVIMPVPDFVAGAPEGPDSREIFEELPEHTDVEVRGDLAVVWVRYRARFGDPGDVREWAGTDVFTLMRHDEVWKIVELAFTPDSSDPET